MTTPDGRSVGELVLDTEMIARQVLIDGPDLPAAAMLRTWGEVVEAAGDMWRALSSAVAPDPQTGKYRPQPDENVMGRLLEMTTALHRSTRGRTWPGDGPADTRLLTMAENLGLAAELIERAGPQRPFRDDARADLAAAKARVIHALYIGSHGVNVALDHHVRGLEAIAQAVHTVPAGQSLTSARAARARIGAFEQLAGSYVSRTYPAVLDGEHRERPSPTRLAQALAGWDVQAHRTLASDRRVVNLMLVAYTQTAITARGHAILDAGASTGHIDPAQFQSRLAPTLDNAQAGWTATARLWRDLTPPSQRRPDSALDVSAGEVRAALHEITRDGAGPAAPQKMASCLDLTAAARTIQQALSSTVEIAHVMRDVVGDPLLGAAARHVNAMARTMDHDLPAAALVRPRDVTGNSPVALPDLVREACRVNLDSTVQGTSDAMAAAAFLDRPLTRERSRVRTPSAGRCAQDHRPVIKSSPPGPGCER